MIKLQAIKRQQTLVDYVVQNAGAVDYLFDTANLNGLSITDSLQPGTLLKVKEENSKVTNVFNSFSIDIITPVRVRSTKSGIGYMKIGTNFIVSAGDITPIQGSNLIDGIGYMQMGTNFKVS